YARTIYASGGDLLSLINDILDLSKVESGTLVLDMADLSFGDLRQHLERVFRPLAERKGLEFSVEFDPLGLDRVHTDGKRLEQILRNMLSNAFKFTEKGRVILTIGCVEGGWTPGHPVLSRAASVIAFTVTDTGVGIPEDKQRIIFEAFQQADSGTSRKYGGTGLGLSISRELAGLLGCQLRLASSTLDKGSSFVLYVPRDAVEASAGTAMGHQAPEAFDKALTPAAMAGPKERPLPAALEDDRKDIHPGDVVLLIVEDNAAFAGVILEGARRNGFKGVVAHNGRSALELAEALKPDAVTLDLRLPDMDGWGVLSRFKNDLAIRHVPVQVIAANEDSGQGIKEGAMAFLAKPISGEELGQALAALRALRSHAVKNLLVLCADEPRGGALNELLEGPDVQVTVVKNAHAALTALRNGRFDCMVMELPGSESLAVLQVLERDMAWTRFPIVAHLRGELSQKDEASFEHVSRAIPVKTVKSMERLLDDTALHLHRAISGMDPTKRSIIENLYQWTPVLADKKALVVDDDVRNIFAMTSLLENYRMKVASAESGADALELLGRDPDIDVVLMDIMMPNMDGYDTIRAIRKDGRFKTLPIIAVTAKAMKGDREKCLAAGASDYITKPVDTHHLLSLMRRWILR
ncbi:MAG TPA: response regulator, partial [bacterium]|nr:response regulator [bacterium]